MPKRSTERWLDAISLLALAVGLVAAGAWGVFLFHFLAQHAR